jgi:hypothetical protein
VAPATHFHVAVRAYFLSESVSEHSVHPLAIAAPVLKIYSKIDRRQAEGEAG